MTTTRNAHLIKSIVKLQTFLTQLPNSSLDQKDVTNIHANLIKALNTSVLRNAKEYLMSQKESSSKNLENLSHAALTTIREIELGIQNLIIKNNLKLETSFIFEELPESDYQVMNEMLKIRRSLALCRQADLLINDTSITKALWLLRFNELKEESEKIIKSFPAIAAWFNEYTSLQTLTNQFNTIESITNCNIALINHKFEDPIIINMQITCKYFIEQLMTTHNLVFTKVEKIYYEYLPQIGKKKAKIILYINDKNINFDGDVATLLKIVLDNHLEAIDIDNLDFKNAIFSEIEIIQFSTKKDYDKLYRKVASINTQIALDSSLLEFGILSFIERNGYEIFLNPQYASCIVKK